MSPQGADFDRSVRADVASVRLLSGVGADVKFEGGLLGGAVRAVGAGKRLFSRVNANVIIKVGGLVGSVRTVRAMVDLALGYCPLIGR